MKSENKKIISLLPSWELPLRWSAFLSIAANIAIFFFDIKQNLTFCLTGTDMYRALLGLIYLIAHFTWVITIPVLIIYAALLWLLHQLTTRSAGR